MIRASKQKNGTYDCNAFYSDFANIDNITPEMTKFAKKCNMLPFPEASTILIVDDVGTADSIVKIYKQETNTWHNI